MKNRIPVAGVVQGNDVGMGHHALAIAYSELHIWNGIKVAKPASRHRLFDPSNEESNTPHLKKLCGIAQLDGQIL
jgi:hypothetical protein